VAQKKPRRENAKLIKPQNGRRRNLLWGGVSLATVGLGAILFYFFHLKQYPSRDEKNSASLIANAQYVGSAACTSCHADEAAEWKKSQHHDAMAVANEQSVLGNFNNAKFSYAGTSSTFFKRDGKFFVNTDGPDGKLADYEIKYTFGIDPLQQYLIAFPTGVCRHCPLRGTRALNKPAASAGSIFIPTNALPTTTSCTGRVRHKTGISCARIVTRRI